MAAAEKTFNDALKGILPAVQGKAVEFLRYFDDSDLDLHLGFSGVNYERSRKDFSRQELDFEVKLYGVAIPEWNDLLNEARLTAVALSLYLAGAALANTTPPAGAAAPLRLLVLDDVLIGLDLAHRLPILRIIEERFADFQVLLLTHDRVWFDLAQLSVAGGLAKAQLPNHDYRAAALHARVALEVKLKSYCNKYKVQISYDLDGRHLNIDHFLDAIERRLLWRGTMALSLFDLQRVKLFRSGVLNPSAHFHPITLAKSEVEAAIRAVELLNLQDDDADFASKADELLRKAAPSAEELVNAACYLRTAFEADLRRLLARQGGTLKFRFDWTKIELAELWDSAKTSMSAVNHALATPLIEAIEAQRVLFLNEWKYSSISALTKADLDAAWDALRVPAPAAPKTRLAAFS